MSDTWHAESFVSYRTAHSCDVRREWPQRRLPGPPSSGGHCSVLLFRRGLGWSLCGPSFWGRWNDYRPWNHLKPTDMVVRGSFVPFRISFPRMTLHMGTCPSSLAGVTKKSGLQRRCAWFFCPPVPGDLLPGTYALFCHYYFGLHWVIAPLGFSVFICNVIKISIKGAVPGNCLLIVQLFLFQKWTCPVG